MWIVVDFSSLQSRKLIHSTLFIAVETRKGIKNLKIYTINEIVDPYVRGKKNIILLLNANNKQWNQIFKPSIYVVSFFFLL